MIQNKLIAIVLLIFLVSGTLLFLVYGSPFGPVLSIIGIIGFFVFNRQG